MIIVIEGADLTGKTTLVNKIKENDNIIHVTYDSLPGNIKDNNLGDFIKYVDKQVLNIIFKIKNKTFIFDRFMLSEIVYSEVLNRKSFYTINDIMINNFYYIILFCSDSILKKRYEVRKDRHLDINNIIKINETYKKLYLGKLCFHLNFSMFRNNNEEESNYIIKKILKMIEEEKNV